MTLFKKKVSLGNISEAVCKQKQQRNWAFGYDHISPCCSVGGSRHGAVEEWEKSGAFRGFLYTQKPSRGFQTIHSNDLSNRSEGGKRNVHKKNTRGGGYRFLLFFFVKLLLTGWGEGK